jgi:hypothetical protein
MEKEITKTTRPISPMFLSWSIDEIQSTMNKENCGSFLLQRKALEALTNLLSLQ